MLQVAASAANNTNSMSLWTNGMFGRMILLPQETTEIDRKQRNSAFSGDLVKDWTDITLVTAHSPKKSLKALKH